MADLVVFSMLLWSVLGAVRCHVTEHIEFDIVVGTFIAFIFCMIAFHCYLKRQQRLKIEQYMDLE